MGRRRNWTINVSRYSRTCKVIDILFWYLFTETSTKGHYKIKRHGPYSLFKMKREKKKTARGITVWVLVSDKDKYKSTKETQTLTSLQQQRWKIHQKKQKKWSVHYYYYYCFTLAAFWYVNRTIYDSCLTRSPSTMQFLTNPIYTYCES